MKYIFSIYVLIAMVIVACHKPKPQGQVKNWTEMVIESENMVSIDFKRDNDTARIIINHMHSPPMPGKLPKPDTLAVVFDSQDIDSIYNIASNIVANPPPSQAACTDFVGDLRILLFYGDYNHHSPGSYMRSVDYTGVCNWNKLSHKTQQLHGILKKRLPKIGLGE